MDKIRRILIISSDKTLRDVLNFCFDGWGYEVTIWESLDEDITPVKKLSPDAIIVDVHTAKKSHLEICQTLKDDFTTAIIPIITLIDKRQLRSQLLNLKYGVDDYLIKPPDPLDLRIRVEMAVRRAQYGFNSSSLTGLPGVRLIEDAVKDKIRKNIPFSFAYVDLDNFKYFNDVYGYMNGDNAILHTAYLLYSAVGKFGNSDDFLGHIGGDDFIFISTPTAVKEICDNFISSFEKTIPFHYSEEDRKRGFVIARDRNREVKQIPLMSVSVAVVNRNYDSDIANIIQINEHVAEMKKYLKNIKGSKFMLDRRSMKKKESECGPFVFERTMNLENYRPLGSILLEKKLLTQEQLNEALRIHWKRGVIFGEILQELNLLKKEQVDEALKSQNLEVKEMTLEYLDEPKPPTTTFLR